MKKIIYFFLMMGVLVTFSLGISPTPADNTLSPISAVAPSEDLPIPDVMPVVYLSGTQYEMGFQYGRQLAPYIKLVKEGVWANAIKRMGRQHTMKDLKTYEKVYKRDVPEILNMIKGVAAGASSKGYNITYYDALLINVGFQIIYSHPLPPTAEALQSCSSIFATGTATKGGETIMGMNRDLDWWDVFPSLYEATVVAFPSKGHRYIATGVMGMLYANGPVMNENGLIVQCLAAPTAPGFKVGSENTSTHVALKYATLDEAKQYFLNLPAGHANVTIADENSAIVIEDYSSDLKVVREPGDFGEQDYLVVTNLFVTPDAKVKNWGGPNEVCPRYNTYIRNADTNLGQMDVDIIMTFMRSHQRWDGTTMNENQQFAYPTPCNHRKTGGTLSSHILVPRQRLFYVAQGNPCGTWAPNSLGEYVKFSLEDSPQKVNKSVRAAASNEITTSSLVVARDGGEASKWLDKAEDEFVEGNFDEDRSAIAKRNDKALALLGEASTHYAKAQAYALKARHITGP